MSPRLSVDGTWSGMQMSKADCGPSKWCISRWLVESKPCGMEVDACERHSNDFKMFGCLPPVWMKDPKPYPVSRVDKNSNHTMTNQLSQGVLDPRKNLHWQTTPTLPPVQWHKSWWSNSAQRPGPTTNQPRPLAQISSGGIALVCPDPLPTHNLDGTNQAQNPNHPRLPCELNSWSHLEDWGGTVPPGQTAQGTPLSTKRCHLESQDKL